MLCRRLPGVSGGLRVLNLEVVFTLRPSRFQYHVIHKIPLAPSALRLSAVSMSLAFSKCLACRTYSGVIFG